MAIPIIDTTTSVLGFRQGEAWYYQPATTNTPAPTSWTWSGLPPGTTADAGSGAIHGPATSSGVYLAKLVATNASGDSAPVIIPIGIFERSWMDDGAVPINIDLRTGRVYPHGLDSWQTGDPALFCKSGDYIIADIGFTMDGGKSLIPIGPSVVTVGLKEFDPEGLLAVSDGGFETIGEWDQTRYRVLCFLEASKLEAALSNYEGDVGTAFSALCEIQWQQPLSFGGSLRQITRSSQTFAMRLAREIVVP
jgi:hypothetical protein